MLPRYCEYFHVLIRLPLQQLHSAQIIHCHIVCGKCLISSSSLRVFKALRERISERSSWQGFFCYESLGDVNINSCGQTIIIIPSHHVYSQTTVTVVMTSPGGA